MSEIISVFKPEGLTPFQLINKFRSKYPYYAHEKISVAGRLDPMASGLVLFLIGQANKKREFFQSFDKTYVFTLLYGITTDTYDILGLITSSVTQQTSVSLQTIGDVVPTCNKSFIQSYPPYSAKTVHGKPLFYWARTGQLSQILLPKKEVTIKNLECISRAEITSNQLMVDVSQRINTITGDFRQQEILERWQKITPQLPSNMQLFSFQARVSSGTYIRSLCYEMGRKMGAGGIAYTIVRTAIGDYTLEDAIRLNEQ
jgi:tRNA pseudouridine55 synthase